MLVDGLVLPALSILFTRKSGAALQKARAGLSADMLETFQGLEDLQAAGAEQRWQAKVQRGSEQVGRYQNYYGLLSGLNNGLSLLAVNLTLLAVLVVAIPQVNAGMLSGVSLAVVSLLTLSSFEATNSLPQAAQNLTASIASAKRLFELVENRATGERMQPLPDLTPDKIQGAQELLVEALSFAYSEPGEKVLDGVNLKLERGKLVVLVGPSGAGKTSLVNLLLRFWEPVDGKVTLDGEDMLQYSAESSRKLFGVISQTNYFFAETLRNNLLYARPEAADAELLEALQMAELGEWYRGLPDGLDTWLGEQGARMSGGEAQRLAIARVLLQSTPFILLDEPTANLDPDTEQKLLTTLFRLFREKGVLMITHRLVMLDQADEIVFLERGKIIESGKQSELIEKDGAYRRFWQMQRNTIGMNLA
jgi:ATP-binding cassette subfamily C protein CydC